MSIIKVEFSFPELLKTIEEFQTNRIRALDILVNDVKTSVGKAIDQLVNTEMSIFLGKAEQSDNKRNGYSEKDYTFKGIGTVRLKIPLDRKLRFESSIIPKHERMDPRLKEDMAALHLAGLSSRTLAMMSQRILGVDISHKTISDALPILAEQAKNWLKRDITEEYWALFIDGTNFNIRRRGSIEREPSLVVLGIDSNNCRSVLAIEPGNRDSAENWRMLFKDLKSRGLKAEKIKIGVMDGLPGLENVFVEEFSKATTARCWFHALSNANAKTPAKYTEEFNKCAKKIMYAENKAAALDAFKILKQDFSRDCQRAVACLEKDINSLVSHYDFDPGLWKSLKTTNAVERIHKEFKRRTKSMEALGESTLMTLVAFTALRLEMAWKRRAVDTYATDHLGKKKRKNNVISLDKTKRLAT